MAVAVDVQGPPVVRPWVEAAGVTFPVVVDTTGVFTAAFGLDVVRAALLFDEHGEFIPPIRRIDIDQQPDRGDQIVAWLQGAAAPPSWEASDMQAAAAPSKERAEGIGWYRIAGMALVEGDRDLAATALDEAWARIPDNLQLRKQRWALRHPERFYTGEIDFDWQAEQRRSGR